ncbi:major facilitator family transporter domain protein [Burkholderia pseudomallei MSHR4308]|nr:major facilitator family transporter domain protein [Burkholderia pseudomallei MSHR4308]
MITVIDHAKPWLRPSNTLAAITHSQFGAAMIMNGTGNPSSQPATSTRLRPQVSAS